MTQDNSTKKQIALFSQGIAKKTNISTLLNANFILNPSDNNQPSIDYVIGWGRKDNTQQAIQYANKNRLPFYHLEDGFIHSLGQGVLGQLSYSLVKDKQGIYYDATQPSDLEQLILEQTEKADYSRSRKAIKRIINANITKYNNAPLLFKLTKKTPHVILLVDQTAGDMSLHYGNASKNTFKLMLQTAINEHPNTHIIIKTHPDVIQGKKQGSFDLTKQGVAQNHPNIQIISQSVNPIVLLKQVDIIYVATSQLGFEALMLGKKVVCFASPFYAGWGLTDDRSNTPLRRNKKRSLEQVFNAAYIQYSCYLHPDYQVQCELEDLIEWFELQYHYYNKNSAHYLAYGFTFWKRGLYTQAFLQSPDNQVTFVNSNAITIQPLLKKYPPTTIRFITWSSKNLTHLLMPASQYYNIPLHFMEDGFLRSTGLGSDFTAPSSLVIDEKGIYYDPTTPSDLEELLQNKRITQQEINRAKQLKQLIINCQVSKYNTGQSIAFKPRTNNKTVILIPGQVENDASIQKGCIDIKTNTQLIIAVYNNTRNAYLIYKPHPDVVSGNRQGAVNPSITARYCNEVIENTSITDCIQLADEVHTMTSLVGFEALLRNKKVHCYGIPFYSGWGLTIDRHTCHRRTANITIDELVAATYIRYPRYINWQTGGFTSPEFIVQQLNYALKKQQTLNNRLPRVLRIIKQWLAILKSRL